MTQAHTSRDHAALAPSAAHRWTHCPGSVVLEAQFPRTSNRAADEGTAAHEFAAHCLNSGFDPRKWVGRVVDIAGDSAATRFLAPAITKPATDTQFLIDEEMADGVLGYVKLVRQQAAPPNRMAIEKRLYATPVHEDCWGTGDAIVYDEASETLHVFDLKYGRGVVVEPVENPQPLIYAIGALGIWGNLPINAVVMHIYQPRAPHPDGPHRTWALPLAAVKERAAVLAERATLVDAAGNSRVDNDPVWNETYLAAGDHCRFCKASAICPAQMEQALDVARSEFGVVGEEVEFKAPALMDPDELGRVLKFARRLQHWIADVEEHANAEALAGRVPGGFKMVEGRRGARSWIDEARALSVLPVLTSVDEAAMYEAPKLLSPAKLEKLLPKDERAAIASLIEQKPGKSSLVPIDDPRAPVRADAASEFASVADDVEV